MEVAGVVFGALPLIVIALENYHKVQDKVADVRQWSQTIRTISDEIWAQERQLRVTLESVGLPFEGQITMADVENALQIHQPEHHKNLIQIIRDMDNIIDNIAQYLYPDSQGPVSCPQRSNQVFATAGFLVELCHSCRILTGISRQCLTSSPSV